VKVLFIMNPLKALFGKEERFLGLIEASAEEGWVSVQELESLMSGSPAVAALSGLFQARERERQIDAELCELLCQSKNTPLDRGDIELLARALGRIPRGIKKFAERHQLYAQRIADASFATQLQMLKSAVGIVRQMVRELHAGPRLDSAKTHHDSLQRIESEADILFITSVLALYQQRGDPVRAIMLKDLYELMERAIDRCRTTGNIVLRIVLKTT
jgi:uncharacterized protein